MPNPYPKEPDEWSDEVEIIDLPAEVPGDRSARLPSFFSRQRAEKPSVTKDAEEDKIEITDLPPDEVSQDLGTRLVDFFSQRRVEEPAGVKEADEFEVEISDLPPEESSRDKKEITSTFPFWRRNRRSIGLLFLLLTLLLGSFLITNVGGLSVYKGAVEHIQSFFSKQPSPTPAAIRGNDQALKTGREPLILANPYVQLRSTPPGPSPQNCPPSTAIDERHGIQEEPLRITGFTGPRALLQLQPMAILTTQQKQFAAWGAPIRLEMNERQLATVWLTLVNLGGQKDPVFSSNPLTQQPEPGMSVSTNTRFGTVRHEPSTLILNPNRPESTDGEALHVGEHVWETAIYINEAGCYALIVAWAQGRWQINFAAGSA